MYKPKNYNFATPVNNTEYKKNLPWIQGQVDQNFHNKQAIILLYFNNITWLE